MSRCNAVVTGGARGIGRKIAERLASRGDAVIIWDLLDGGEQTAQEIASEYGVETEFIKCDVTDIDAVTAAAKSLYDEKGSIDILVNNAGITRDNLMMRMKEGEWDAVLTVNLKSVFVCTKAVSRFMMKQKSGAIVNIASVIGIMGNAGQANYAASKAGVIGLTKSNAKEFASRGIRVNAVAPGYIRTKMTEELSEEQTQNIMAYVPLKRMGTPDDVADAVAFLSGAGAGYITGQVLVVDGGLVM